MGNEKKIYKSFDDWAQEYDMEEMNGIGSGCSYNFLLGMKPAWDARQVEIDKLKKELAEKNEVLGFYADRENWRNGGRMSSKKVALQYAISNGLIDPTDLIISLRDSVDGLSKNNKDFAEAFGEQFKKIISIEKENAELRAQVDRMKNCFNCGSDTEDHCLDNTHSVACDKWEMKNDQ